MLSEEYQADSDVVLVAVLKDCRAFKYASDELNKNTSKRITYLCS